MLIQSYGRTPSSAVFLLSLILTGFQTFGCPPEFWSEEGDSASDVFIQFVQEELGENWAQKMNEKKYGYRSYSTPWEQEIIPSTRSWSAKDAQEFLDVLVNRVGKQNTCFLLARSLSHLKSISYYRDKISQDILQNFKERIAYYDDYMGEEATTEMMRKSLAGFAQGALQRVKDMIQFLENYLGSKELVIRILKRDPQIFSTTFIDEIQPVLDFLENLIGYKTLIEMMTRKKEDSKYGRYLSLSKLKALQNILRPLINELTVSALKATSLKFRNSLQRELIQLAELNYDRLVQIQKQVAFWTTYSGFLNVAKAMKKSLGILFDNELYNIKEKIKAVEKEAPDKKTIVTFTQKDPEFFIRSSKRQFLKGFQKWLTSPPPQKPSSQKKTTTETTKTQNKKRSKRQSRTNVPVFSRIKERFMVT